MTDKAPEAAAAQVWRMSPGRMAQFAVLTLMLIVTGAMMGIGPILVGEYQVVGVVVIVGTTATATWSALQLRSSLRLADGALIVRTGTTVHEIPLQQLAFVSGNATGISISTSDGRRITSFVAADSRWSRRFGLETKATAIVQAIDSARQASHLEADKVPASADHDRVPAAGGTVPARADRAPADRLVRTIRISALMTALGAALLIGSFAAVSHVEGAAESLLASGIREPGTVTAFSGGQMDVRFVRNGRPATARITVAAGDVYHNGDRVTVVYDPANMDRVRTIREDGESRWSGDVLSLLIVLSVFLLIGGVSNLIRARRQRLRLARSRPDARG